MARPVDEAPPQLRPAPEHGEHTEQALADELGLDRDRIIALKEMGVIP